VANLSQLPPEQIDGIQRVLRGEKLVRLEEVFSIQRGVPHGGQTAVLDA